MIKINNDNIDLILQVEEDTQINRIIQLLSLDINSILIICPEIFFSKFVQYLYDLGTIDLNSWINEIEESLKHNKDYIVLDYTIKGKMFSFHFFITSNKQMIIHHPTENNIIINNELKQIKLN